MLKTHRACLENSLRGIAARYVDERRVLDMGCGDGTRTILWDAPGKSLTGLDVADWMRPDLKTRIALAQGDFAVEKTSLPGGTFDLVFSFDVIEHVKDPGPMLAEAMRLLKPGGYLILGTPNRHRILGWVLIVLGMRKFPYPPDPAHRNVPYSMHEVEYTAPELKKILEKSGFETLRTHRLFYGLTGRLGFERLFNLPFSHNIIIEARKPSLP